MVLALARLDMTFKQLLKLVAELMRIQVGHALELGGALLASVLLVLLVPVMVGVHFNELEWCEIKLIEKRRIDIVSFGRVAGVLGDVVKAAWDLVDHVGGALELINFLLDIDGGDQFLIGIRLCILLQGRFNRL